MRPRRKRQPVWPGPPFESCGNCTADGWITRYYGPSLEYAYETRCPCWEAHQAKLDAEHAAVGD